jgi:hypothetical protein
MTTDEREIDYILPVNQKRVQIVRRGGIVLAVAGGLAIYGGATAIDSESSVPREKVSIEKIRAANNVTLGGIFAEGAAAAALILTHNRKPTIIYKR